MDAAMRYHAFFYSAGVTRDLGMLADLDTFGLAINGRGDVVGFGDTGGPNSSRAFLSMDGGTPRDLNDLIDPASGWSLSRAEGINDLGEIVGTGQINGQNHAFLLTPNAAVPEPSAVVFLISGGALLASVAMRRSRLGRGAF